MTDQLEARSFVAQLITKAVLCIDDEVALNHIIDACDNDTDLDDLAHTIVDAAHSARITLSWGDQSSWRIERGGKPLHTVASLAEAQTIGQLLVRADTGNHTVTVRWVCVVCDSEEDLCPACGDGDPSVLFARGILTDDAYEIVRIDA